MKYTGWKVTQTRTISPHCFPLSKIFTPHFTQTSVLIWRTEWLTTLPFIPSCKHLAFLYKLKFSSTAFYPGWTTFKMKCVISWFIDRSANLQGLFLLPVVMSPRPNGIQPLEELALLVDGNLILMLKWWAESLPQWHFLSFIDHFVGDDIDKILLLVESSMLSLFGYRCTHTDINIFYILFNFYCKCCNKLVYFMQSLSNYINILN